MSLIHYPNLPPFILVLGPVSVQFAIFSLCLRIHRRSLSIPHIQISFPPPDLSISTASGSSLNLPASCIGYAAYTCDIGPMHPSLVTYCCLHGFLEITFFSRIMTQRASAYAAGTDEKITPSSLSTHCTTPIRGGPVSGIGWIICTLNDAIVVTNTRSLGALSGVVELLHTMRNRPNGPLSEG